MESTSNQKLVANSNIAARHVLGFWIRLGDNAKEIKKTVREKTTYSRKKKKGKHHFS